jgi:hypothetical protein
MESELLDAARLHSEAVKIIANAISEMGHPSLRRQDIEGNAVAILARLAHANILIERYDAAKETGDGLDAKDAVNLIKELAPRNSDAEYRVAVKEIVDSVR